MRVEELQKMYRLEDSYWWFVARRRLVRSLVQRFAPDHPRILDVGCGTGGTMDALQDLGDVSGVDISEEALECCRERGHTRLSQCGAEALEFDDGSFDVAICCDILEHLDDDAAAFSEVMRILKPGGIAFVTVPAFRFLWSEHDIALDHRRRYAKRELRDMMKEAGARVLKLTYAVGFVFPIVLAVRVLGRLRLRKPGKPHTQLMSMPAWLNRLLICLHDVENWIVVRLGFPFGTSLVAVARKPESSPGSP